MKLFILMFALLWPLQSYGAGCEALKDEKAYQGKFEKFKYLIEGKDGWIFRSKQDLRMKFAVDEQAWDLLFRVQMAFRDRGIELVMAIPPTRGMVAHTLIPQGLDEYNSIKAQGFYKQFLEQAQNKNVNIVGTPDIREGTGYFYRADHHWTSAGAREMATEVADAIKKFPVYKNIRKNPYRTILMEKRTIKSSFSAPVQSICGNSLEDLADDVYVTTLQHGGLSEDDLFAELPPAQIALVGTSNSRRDNLDMNFEGFLKEALSADVYNAALAGAGIEDPLFAYLDSLHFKEGNARIIIWEIPGYYNLSSDRSKDMLRGILAVLKGDCRKPLLESKENQVRSENTPIFRLPQDFQARNSYFVFEFNRPVNIQGFLTLVFGETRYETFKFKRSKKYPPSSLYLYKPDYEGEESLTSATFKFPADMADLSYEARICRYE